MAIGISGEALKFSTNIETGCLYQGRTGETFSLNGEWLPAEAHTAGGVRTSLKVTSRLSIGLYLEGVESSESAKQPRIEAEHSPVTAAGQLISGKLSTWKFPASSGLTVNCEAAQFSGELPTGNELSLVPSYSSCNTANLLTRVVTHGCRYKYHVLNVGPPYAGSSEIACAGETEAIEIRIYASKAKEQEDKALCVASFGPQAETGTVGMANTGTGSGREVVLTPSLEKLRYTWVKNSILCGGTAGVHEDGTFTESTNVFGSY